MKSIEMDMKISLGTLIHLVVLIASLAAMYGRIDARLIDDEKLLQSISMQSTRTEHYLQSNDVHYWEKVNQNGDGDGRK